MTFPIANSTIEADSSSGSFLGSWKSYELLMVLIFVVGMGLLRHIIASIKQLFWFIFRRKTGERKEDRDMANAVLEIIKKDSLKPGADPFREIYDEIKEAPHNPHFEPFDVLHRMQLLKMNPNIQTYNTLLESCIKAKNFQSASQLFTEMQEPGSMIFPDLCTFNIYMNGIVEAINSGEHIDLKIIRALLKEMDAREIRPTTETFQTILEICAVSCQADLAWRFFMEMQQSYSLSPNTSSFVMVLQAIRTSDAGASFLGPIFQQIISFFTSTVEIIDDQLINSLVEALGKYYEFEKLAFLYETVRKLKKKLSLVTYGKLIGIYGTQKDGRKIDQLATDMKRNGIQPNEITYGCLMESYLKCDLIERVEEVYNEIIKEGKVQCNIIIYTTMIRAYGRRRQFAKVMKVYETIKQDPQVVPNRIAFNALLDSCVKCDQNRKMVEIYEDMLQLAAARKHLEEDNIKPDLITYSTLIKGMCKADEMDKALKLYNEMKEKGLSMDEVVYNSLLDGFVKSRKPIEECNRVIADLQSQNLRFSNYTYSILIKLYSKQHKVEKAIEILQEMKRNRIQPGVIVYTCLLQTCIKNKRIDKAIEIFTDMKNSKVQPDEVAYNTIVNGCVYSGKLLNACIILSQAIDRNVRLADDIYNNVLRNFLINHKMTPEQKHEYATKVCNYIVLQKIPVSQDYYNQVLSSFVFVPSSTSSGYYYPYYTPPTYYDYSYYSYYSDHSQYPPHH